MHVLSGVIYILTMLVWSRNGRYGPDNYSPIEILGLYWHFVDLIWILVFTFVYLL
jgi:heme/copper-type cytochrome/quinol oxidase subunit 3